MSELPYLGRSRRPPLPRSGSPDALDAVRRRSDRGPRPPRRQRPPGALALFGLLGLCLAWTAVQALGAHRPVDAPLEPPRPSELVEVRVDVAAITRAAGAPITWTQLFARYGLELAVQRQTLDFPGNAQNGRAPDPNAPITRPFVTVVLSG